MAKKKSLATVLPSVPVHPLAVCQPRGDRVVVRRDGAKTVTDGGIMLVESGERHKRQTGTVVSVGPGNLTPNGERIPVDLMVHDRVILTNYAGLEIKDPVNMRYMDDEYILLREEDVLAVLPADWKE